MTENALPVFSARYGLRTHIEGWGHESYASRHAHRDEDHGWSHCEPDQRFRCACGAADGWPPRCCARASAEDQLCDACRSWCVYGGLAVGEDQ
jgi:hypothetical protein